MSFNLFGPTTKNDIRVGYISTERGYVDSVSICEANDYAKKNPGTVFILRNRNIIRYLNINEVNDLTEEDLLSDADSCTGIQFESECGPPKVFFYGGGGVGVQANPIIGLDGAVLAIDLVHGGHGYQYAPIVDVKDKCGIGAGAVTRAILGEIVETYEVYDQEGDFEDYELCLPEDVGFGRRYDPDGKDIGSWDPTLYANLNKDPINREIQKYQDFLQKLSKPWWTTRKKTPLSVTSGSKVTRTKFNVTDKTYRETQDAKGNTGYVGLGQIWNDFMNSHAISPVPPSNVPGSDFAADLFTFEWEEDFPYDGEYIFRGCGDGAIRDLYIDNDKVTTLTSYNEAPAVAKKEISAGVHRIRLDLKNGGITDKVSAEPASPQITVKEKTPQRIDVDFNVYGQGKATEQMSFSFVSEDGSHSFVIKGVNKNKQNRKDTIRVKPNVKYKVTASSSKGKVEQGIIKNGKKDKEGGIGESNKIFADHIASANDNDDIQITTSSGIFKSSNKRKVGGRSTFDLSFKVDYQPKTITYTPSFGKSIFNTSDYINKADRKLWKTDPIPSGAKDNDFATTYGVIPFDRNTQKAKKESFAGTHVIRWAFVEFPVDGNYVIETWVDDNLTLYIGNRNAGGRTGAGNGLIDVEKGGDEVIITKRGFTANGVSTGKSSDTRYFKAGKYRIRAELEQGDFGPLSPSNPMTLAINITLAGSSTPLASAKSWNDNPMGVALTIDAPLPPIPQEPIPQQEGRCPNNPIWSTRFPGSAQKWWPVQYSEVLRANGIIPWSNFLNRYAVSPIPPLSIAGSDGGGIVYKNSWQVDIPYDGFYQFAVQRDETARIYLDGTLAFDIKTAGDMIWKDFRNKPKFQKLFITKGRHTISVELENSTTEVFENIDKKIFSTLDWAVSPTPPPQPQQSSTTEEQKAGSLFVKEGSSYYLLAGGNDLVEIDFVFDWDDNPYIAGTAVTKITIPSEKGGPVVFSRPQFGASGSIRKTGTFRTNKKYGPIIFEGRAPGSPDPKIVNTGSKEDQRQQRINFYDADGNDVNAKLSAVNAKQLSPPRVIQTAPAPAEIPTSQNLTKSGITYSGPPLATYFTGFISPQFKNPFKVPAEEIQGKTWTMTWSNVDFFEDGQYEIKAKVDDVLVIKIDGVVLNTVKIAEGLKSFYYNTTKGKKTLQVELSNIRVASTSFAQNPVYFSLEITKKVSVGTGVSKSWTQNPVAISAILIPPPCPKRIRGKGVVTEVIVDDPGNGYLVPQNDLPPEVIPTYPVSLRLKNVIVTNPGINYNCGVDRIEITPNNGAILDYECDTFGRIVNVKVLNPGLGFTEYPTIRMVTPPADPNDPVPVVPTGVNAAFIPQFEVVRDPIVADLTKLIQVTDLAGLEKTGYVDGRAYYGAVFYKEGVRYAGFYETPGDLVQVYTTLQESIDAQVTTPPSAIQRQGTSVNSNNPRLNLPNTPDNLI
jgi:hypothetical protein